MLPKVQDRIDIKNLNDLLRLKVKKNACKDVRDIALEELVWWEVAPLTIEENLLGQWRVLAGL